MKKANLASTYFANHYNCAQSAFVPFAADVGISEDQALKVACAFGGGMGRQQLTCGAVTGALMAIGMKYGMGANDPEDKKLETYDLTRRFFEEFKKLNGTANCRELLEGLDMNDPADSQVISERNMHNTHCNKYVQDAVSIAEAIINSKKG